jgi:FADH2 O2-dependent halogenase
MKADFDIAVVGSGFAGSLTAMIARKLGHSVVLIERGRHPRFAIGESSTPLANLLLEELANRYALPALLPLTKWGPWQKAHPEIACGLKRGFTFYHHRIGEAWQPHADRSNELLVAASPHDGIADTHWYRPHFDEFLAKQAAKLGVELLEETFLEAADFTQASPVLKGSLLDSQSARRDHEPGRDALLRVQASQQVGPANLLERRHGKPLSLRVRFVIDASGPRGFLHRTLGLKETRFEAMPTTAALYSHFEGVRRWDSLHAMREPPYPVDDAAMHHVFDGGWIWVLRFNNGVTSAGVAADSSLAAELRLADGAPAWERLLARLPAVREQFAKARATLPFVHTPRLAFRAATAAGPNWALLPSAAGFVDPLLSTGFPLTLLGVERLANALATGWNTPKLPALLSEYSAVTLRELDVTAELIGALYSHMADFEIFAALTLLYFAAASFSETARRLEKPALARGFLLHDRKEFAAACKQLLAAARGSLIGDARGQFLHDVAATIEPINVVGLADAKRRNWYPALAADLVAAAPKLGADRAAIDRLLTRCGFSASSTAR